MPPGFATTLIYLIYLFWCHSRHRPWPCFIKLDINNKLQATVISYWNQGFWLAESKFIIAIKHFVIDNKFYETGPCRWQTMFTCLSETVSISGWLVSIKWVINSIKCKTLTREGLSTTRTNMYTFKSESVYCIQERMKCVSFPDE